MNRNILNNLIWATLGATCMALSVGASASELPTAQLAALQCTDNASESCCERWVNTVVSAARVETNPASMLNALPRRVDRWRIIEKRSYCAMKRDIEARDQPIRAVAIAK